MNTGKPNQNVTSKQLTSKCLWLEKLHRCINEKVDSGELPQANFSQHGGKNKHKTKVKKEQVHIKRVLDKESKEGV